MSLANPVSLEQLYVKCKRDIADWRYGDVQRELDRSARVAIVSRRAKSSMIALGAGTCTT